MQQIQAGVNVVSEPFAIHDPINICFANQMCIERFTTKTTENKGHRSTMQYCYRTTWLRSTWC